MGAIFTVPVARAETIDELPGTTIALVADDGEPLHDVIPDLVARGEPITIVIGSEREGLPAQAAKGCDVRATIPMARDSVNAAMAGTIALYEIARAGRTTGAGHQPGRGIVTDASTLLQRVPTWRPARSSRSTPP